MKCMISQPTFLPWLGWFDLVNQSDLVILYDTAQFSKQSWQQRNRIRTIRGLEYLTVPVKTSGRLGQRIIDVEISQIDFEDQFKNKIKNTYYKAPFFKSVMGDLEKQLPLFLANRSLSQLNEGLIRFCFRWLGIETTYFKTSQLNISGQRGEYLAKICEHFNCDEYVSTEGAEKYLIEDYHFFAQKKVSVKIHKYVHPNYKQLVDPFIPYASVIDLIMMYGYGSKDVMQNSERYLNHIST